jgi:NADPH-dependent curcumin reductase CurA
MKQIVLASHPVGQPRAEDFRMEEVATPACPPGGLLLRTIWLSLDPLIRFALDEKPLTGPVRVGRGEVVYGGTVSEVVASDHADFLPGDHVEGRTGWREYADVDPAIVRLRKVDANLAPLSTALGVLGMPGQTAHACAVGIGRVAEGETVVISAAAGAVGSLTGQIAKIRGAARVVGIAGSDAKCAGLEQLGFDGCVNYKADDYPQQLAAACPDGIDVYIENVGGAVTDAVLPLLKYRARMPVCGFIAYYGIGREGPGPDRLPGFMRTIMSKGLEVRGFGGAMVGGQAALDDLAQWVRDGLIQYPEAVVEGLENAPKAFAGIFSGNENIGKLLVRVGGDRA